MIFSPRTTELEAGTTAKPNIEPAHIGDGVYASFDGYHLRLAVNHHTNHAVSLEPKIMRALVAYARQVDETYGVGHFAIR